MAPLTQWIRSLGGAGAVANAAEACTQYRLQEAAVEARLTELGAQKRRLQPGREIAARRAA